MRLSNYEAQSLALSRHISNRTKPRGELRKRDCGVGGIFSLEDSIVRHNKFLRFFKFLKLYRIRGVSSCKHGARFGTRRQSAENDVIKTLFVENVCR